jgi:hypothetical protein
MTPVERTIQWFFDRGIIAGRVDRRMGPIEMDWPGKGVGFADILAVPLEGPVLIQVTSKSNHASRVKKVLASAYAVRTCLQRGLAVSVWSWAADEDEPRIEAITLDML